MKNQLQNNQGFNLLGLMVAVVIVIILSTLTFMWLDPLEQSGKAKDLQRTKAVNVLSAAFKDYSNENGGALPFLGSVTTSSKKVLCQTQSGSDVTCDVSTGPCLRIADEHFYTNNLFELPIDPNKTSEQDTGYYVQKDPSTGQLIVGACNNYGEAINKKTGLKASCDIYAGGRCWYLSDIDTDHCDDVCARESLECVDNVIYGPDIDASGDPYCGVQLNINSSYCYDDCLDDATDRPPGVLDDYSTCTVQKKGIVCDEIPDSGYFAICPCE